MKPTQKHQLSFLKKLIGAFIAIFGMTSLSFAATHTVDNKTGALAQYSSLQDAIDAASAGDTILLAGSGTSYGNVTIDKKLVLFGAGFQHADTQLGRVTSVGTITLTTGTGTSASDSFFSGFTGTFNIGGNISSVIERCYISNATLAAGTNTLIRHCAVKGVSNGAPNIGQSHALDLIIQNSLILGYVNSANDQASVLIDHCNIVWNGVYALSYFGLNYAVVSNSIFYLVGGTVCSYTSFSNNLTYSPSSTIADLVTGTNTGGNNIENTDPLFTSASTSFAFTNDYRLDANSPAKGAASDGTDIGMYGGTSPYPVATGDNILAPAPRIPQLYEMNVQNASVPENGTLSIQVKARKID